MSPVATPLDGALFWIQHGFLPVPVGFQSKQPHNPDDPQGRNWQNLRITEVNAPRYFNRTKQNIGVILGGDDGTADVDLDCMEAVSAAPCFLPDTGIKFGRASKPGSHWIYRIAPPVPSKKFTDPIDRKTLLELRCQDKDGSMGHQTVVPPSVHPSGEQVRFEKGVDCVPGAIASSTLLTAVSKTAAAALLARHWPGEGSRHEAFLALAGILNRAEWSLVEAIRFHGAIYRVLWSADADMQSCKREVESTFERRGQGVEITGFQSLSKLIPPTALKAALTWLGAAQSVSTVEVREWPDVIPFLDREATTLTPALFPGFLGEMVAAVSRATETPLELAGMLGLAVTAACVAKKVSIEPESGYEEPLNIYTAVGMESGNRKTAVLNRIAEPLMNWERAETERLLPDRQRAESEYKTQQAYIDALRKKAARGSNIIGLRAQIAELELTLPKIPTLPRLWTQDVTPEQLPVLMADHGERIALLSDEGGIFDLLAGRYNKGIPNLDVFLQAHSGTSVRIDRGSRPPIHLQRPALTVGISPQPHVLQTLADRPGFRGRGLLARFLYALPPSPLGSRNLETKPVPAHIERAYGAGILRLLGLNPPADSQPWRLRFSPAAYHTWKDFQRQTEVLMKEGERLHHLKDWASKLPGAAARLAGILNCVGVNPSESTTVDVAIADQAICLASALIDHALLVFDLMQQNPLISDAQRLLKWARKQPDKRFTIRACFCAHQRLFKTVGAMQPAIQQLEQRGYIRPVARAASTGRPSEVYALNPKLTEGEP
jgi:hypothetical protein